MFERVACNFVLDQNQPACLYCSDMRKVASASWPETFGIGGLLSLGIHVQDLTVLRLRQSLQITCAWKIARDDSTVSNCIPLGNNERLSFVLLICLLILQSLHEYKESDRRPRSKQQ